jgi:hypothetical protein
VGDKVLARDFTLGADKWREGVVTKCAGSHVYFVQVGDNVWKRHVDALIGSNLAPVSVHVESSPSVDSTPVVPESSSTLKGSSNVRQPSPRRTGRHRRPPGHLKDYSM